MLARLGGGIGRQALLAGQGLEAVVRHLDVLVAVHLRRSARSGPGSAAQQGAGAKGRALRADRPSTP